VSPAEAADGFVEPALHAELPGLRLRWTVVQARPRPSPPEVRRRLGELAARYRGDTVVAMRTLALPHAYRAFFRQVGLDPDVQRVPSEQLAVSRLLEGGFRSGGLLEDALRIAMIETGVPVGALDAGVLAPGGLGIRRTIDREPWGEGSLPAGLLAVADPERVHALLFGETAPGHGAGARSSQLALFAIGVAGVPALSIEEALWTAVEVLRAGVG
jgi:hypothetical protein